MPIAEGAGGPPGVAALVEVRQTLAADLGDAAAILGAAFGAVLESLYGRRVFRHVRGAHGFLPPQGQGIAQALAGEGLRSWRERGVLLMGLETFPSSSLHINLYRKLGFHPAWTGVSFRGALDARDWH